MKEKTKVVCQRCGKVIAVLEGPPFPAYIPNHLIRMGRDIWLVCDECYEEYMKLLEELDRYKEKKIREWFEKGKNDHKEGNS